jgi:hypothetical protein
MGKKVWGAVVVAVAACQGPESFRVRFDAGTTMGMPGSPGSSGGAGTGALPSTTGAAGGAADMGIPPSTAGNDGATGASGAGGGAGSVVTGAAGTGPGTGGAAASTTTGTGSAGVAGTFGGAGAGAGTSGTIVDAGASAGRGAIDAGTTAVDAAREAPPSVAYASTSWKPTASITAPGNADLPPNAFDGKIATRWTTGRNQTGDETFTVDLGQVTSVSRVVLDDTTHGQDFPAAYSIEVSTNGTTFTAVKTGRGAAITDVAFPRVNARYVRIRQTGTTPANGSWWSIDELKIYS